MPIVSPTAVSCCGEATVLGWREGELRGFGPRNVKGSYFSSRDIRRSASGLPPV